MSCFAYWYVHILTTVYYFYVFSSPVHTLPDQATDLSVNQEFTDLKAQVLHLEQAVSSLQSQTQTQDQKYAAVLQNVLSNLSEKTDEISHLQQDHNKTKEELKTTQEQLEMLQEFRKSCEANLTSLAATVTGLTSARNVDVANLEAEVTNLKSASQSTSIQVASLSSDITSLKSTSQSTKTQLTTLSSDMSSLKSNSQSTKSQLTTLSSDVSNLKSSTQSTRTQVASLSSDLSGVKSRQSQSEVSVKDLQAEVASVQKTLQHSDIHGLTTDVSHVKHDLDQAKKDLTSVESSMTSLQESVRNQDSKTGHDIHQTQTLLSQVAGQCTSNAKSLDTLTVAFNKTETTVVFTARANHNLTTIHSNNVLKLDQVHLNIGGAYHENTGIFKVPVAGYYLFWAGVDARDRKNFELSLVRNSNRVVANSGSSSSGAALTYVARAQKGDQLWFRIDHNLHVLGSWQTYCGGFLLQTI